MSSIAARIGGKATSGRWRHLALGIMCMLLIANLQYGWTLFVAPLHAAHGWSVANIQVAFTLIIAFETWGSPLNGWFADRLGARLGPQLIITLGGALVALGWTLNSFAESLSALYLGSALAGFGAGGVYSAVVGIAAKWFQDRRGLAVALTAAGWGAGSAVSIIPLQMAIASQGYNAAFLYFGLAQGALLIIIGQLVRYPSQGESTGKAAVRISQTKRSRPVGEMLKSPIFWMIYLLNGLMFPGGLIIVANLAAIAESYHVSKSTAVLGLTTLSVTLVFTNIMNGGGRPFFGWMSDNIGRTGTMIIAFGVGAAAYLCLALFGEMPLAFVLSSGLVFFCWGEITSLFPAMCADLFGPQYATTNLALLYTSKGAAAFLVPFGSLIRTATGSWNEVLYLAAAINVLTVVLVIAVLRPAEIRYHVKDALEGAQAN